MLLKGIGLTAAVLALWTAAGMGIFTGAVWLWALPLIFVGYGLVLILLAYLFLLVLCRLVNQEQEQERDSAFYRAVTHLYIEALITLVRLKIETSGLEKTPREGRFLLVCNHQNESDPGILMHYFKKNQLAFIAKKEAAHMFVIGDLMHKLMCQLLDRENDRQALKVILKCVQMIRDDMVSVGVFPEGGIKGEWELHPFRPGVFKIAQKTKVPIVVCTLHGTTDLFRNMKRLKQTKVQLKLLQVIEPAQYEGMTTVELSGMVYRIMEADLTEYNCLGSTQM